MAAIVFDHVWKKFRQGERHDSLRDLIPSIVRRFMGRDARQELRTEEFWALQDVSFQVEPGKALGIIGSNGAGKSTTLKLLTRILKPTRGSYETKGRVGALIEVAAGFHPDLTGRENVFLQGAIMGMPRAEIARQFDAIVEFAGISQFIDTPVKRYSSGMNARLGFSIAAYLNPDVLLIDEVLAVGDMEFQHRCFDRMKTFTDRGTAIAFVSHNLKAVMDLCDQTMLLEKGRMKAIGPTSEVIASYMTRNTGATSPDVSLSAEVVAHRRGTPLSSLQELLPGDELFVRCRASFKSSTEQATIGVNVWDARRATFAFEGSLDLSGVAPIAARPGEDLTLEFALTTHLNRGLYQLHLNVYDLTEQRFMLDTHPVATFNVVERTSQNGVANLYLRPLADARLTTSQDAALATSSTS